MVGITNKSMAAMSGAWLRKKVRHSWLGDPRRLTMYLTPVAPTIQSNRTRESKGRLRLGRVRRLDCYKVKAGGRRFQSANAQVAGLTPLLLFGNPRRARK